MACGGGGGGGGGADPVQSPSVAAASSLKMKVQPASLFNILPGTTFSIREIGGSQAYLLQDEALDGNDFQAFEVELGFSQNYVFSADRYGAPYLSTVLMGSQIEKASETGILNVGEINAITTFFASLLQSDGLQKASEQRGKSEQVLRDTMAQYFSISSVFDFSQLSFENINQGRLNALANFAGVSNRINILLFYHGMISSLNNPTGEQLSALITLYSTITNPNSTLDALAAALALPGLPNGTQDLDAIQSRLAESGYVLQGEGSLSLGALRNIFEDPQANLQILNQAMTLATGQLVGSMGGYSIGGMSLQLLSEQGAVVQEIVSQSDGRFAFQNLEGGTYTLKPNQEGYEFRPKSIQVQLQPQQNLKGFDFTNFLVVGGSTQVPNPTDVVKGVSYVDSDGETVLEGAFTVLTPSPENVVEGVFYGDETGVALQGNLILPSETEVLKGVAFGPGGSRVGQVETVQVVRAPPVAVMSTSRFRISVY